MNTEEQLQQAYSELRAGRFSEGGGTTLGRCGTGSNGWQLLVRAPKRGRLHGGPKVLGRCWRWCAESQESGSRWAEQQQPDAFRV